jgi:hypothetical protein
MSFPLSHQIVTQSFFTYLDIVITKTILAYFNLILNPTKVLVLIIHEQQLLITFAVCIDEMGLMNHIRI